MMMLFWETLKKEIAFNCYRFDVLFVKVKSVSVWFIANLGVWIIHKENFFSFSVRASKKECRRVIDICPFDYDLLFIVLHWFWRTRNRFNWVQPTLTPQTMDLLKFFYSSIQLQMARSVVYHGYRNTTVVEHSSRII